MEHSEQILKQLRWIKWLIGILALSFAVIAAGVVWTSFEMRSSFNQTHSSKSFAGRASALMDAGKLDEVLALCDEHEKIAPKEPYIAWFRGKAYYQQGRFNDALAQMRQAEALAPHWRDQYTGPYIKSIEEKTSAQKKR